jgi:hypothetical protein
MHASRITLAELPILCARCNRDRPSFRPSSHSCTWPSKNVPLAAWVGYFYLSQFIHHPSTNTQTTLRAACIAHVRCTYTHANKNTHMLGHQPGEGWLHPLPKCPSRLRVRCQAALLEHYSSPLHSNEAYTGNRRIRPALQASSIAPNKIRRQNRLTCEGAIGSTARMRTRHD